MDREAILALLPHRPPFLFVDRVVEAEPGVRIVVEHDVREDAFWVPAHFPGSPVMPGVLITEVMAQAAALLWLGDNTERAGKPVFLVGLDKLRFRQPVRPPCTLRVQVDLVSERRPLLTLSANATVGDVRVANGQLLATLGA